MRKIIVNTFVSLDGVMQAPGGPEEDTSGGFEHGGWVASYFDEGVGKFMGDVFASPFELLLGHRTYDIFAAHWPRVAADPPPQGVDDGEIQMAKKIDGTTRYVASRTKPEFTWEGSEWLGNDPVARLREIKANNGPDLLVPGSADFIQTLLKADLVDQFKLLIFPVILGKGKRLFGAGVIPIGFHVQQSTMTDSGTICVTYVRDGSITTGDFSLQQD
ncbi:dihydrofolate reductase family protein [Microbulbifer sp. MLAF003]|uniref:dihydrofolate reductase family protein n=1 Tax=Microbulbifer sp. MLAF003 TaxID=3032582 RepID=UPI0024ACA248|nr:dihydrofolate reductase family protein [Microbulbifer sp. MLAF003]WHI53367.1 dihydrofolate reductase family protein [Microbulbifer sp. MLAF003]